MLFTPLSQTVTPSRTPSPSSVTYLMDGPLGLNPTPNKFKPHEFHKIHHEDLIIGFSMIA